MSAERNHLIGLQRVTHKPPVDNRGRITRMIGRVMHDDDIARPGTANAMRDEGRPNVGDENDDFIDSVSLDRRQKLAADTKFEINRK